MTPEREQEIRRYSASFEGQCIVAGGVEDIVGTLLREIDTLRQEHERLKESLRIADRAVIAGMEEVARLSRQVKIAEEALRKITDTSYIGYETTVAEKALSEMSLRKERQT